MDNNNTKYMVGSGSYDASMVPCLNNNALNRLAHDIGETNRDVKQSEAEIRADLLKGQADIRQEVRDAECNIRHDIGQAECNLTKTVMAAECNLSKEILTSRHLLAEEITKQGYENRLLQKDTVIALDNKFTYLSDRLGDKLAHGFEEVNETLAEIKCCTCGDPVCKSK